MRTTVSVRRVAAAAAALLGALVAGGADPALAGEGRILVPYVTGRPETHVFAGHPGWVDAYHAGGGRGISARIGNDGRFRLPTPPREKPLSLVLTFDRMETPPIVVPRYDPGDHPDILIPTEYACVPDGYPGTWDREYAVRATNYHQSIVPRCTMLYGVTVFDGPKVVEWGNKLHVAIHDGGPDGEPLRMRFHREPHADHQSAGHSDKETPRIGWRHGDVPVEPGKRYTIRVGGYRSHGGKHFRLDAYVRPDEGLGYADGEVLGDGKPLGGDLCFLLFGNGHGQLVENHIRSEEWEIFLPRHRPATNWGQTFEAHGESLAGISFWAASAPEDSSIECRILVRPDGTWEHPAGPQKVAVAHESPLRPIIRYPEHPGVQEGYEEYYRLPADLYQVAYAPDEVPLERGRTYYLEVVSSRPILMYADGDHYHDGHAYYEALQVDRVGKPWTFHSPRWTLAMGIVTYAKKGGGPLAGGQAVDSTAELVAAVRDGAEGATIEIAPGTYELDAPLEPKRGMTLRGAGMDRTTITHVSTWKPSTRTLPDPEMKTTGMDTRAYLVRLQDKAADITLANMTLRGPGLHGAVYGWANERLHIHHVRVQDTLWTGIRTFLMRRARIHDCEFIDAGGRWKRGEPGIGGGITGGAIFAIWMTDSEIAHNRFTRTQMGKADEFYGIKCRQGKRCRIHHNTIEVNFSIELPFENDEDVEIDHNICHGTISIPKYAGGAVPESGRTFHIHHNWMRDSYSIEFVRNGVEVSHNLFDFDVKRDHGNLISGFGRAAARGPASFHDNLISNPGRGVVWINEVYDNLEIRNNHIVTRTTATPRKDGLFGFNRGCDFKTITIRDNVIECRGQARPLLRCDESYGAVIRNNRLTNVSDTDRYENPREERKAGLQEPLRFECGVHGERTVDGWDVRGSP